MRTGTTILVLFFFMMNADAQSLFFKYLGKNTVNEDMVSSFMGNINLNLDGGHTIITSTSSNSEDAYVVRLDKNGKRMASVLARRAKRRGRQTAWDEIERARLPWLSRRSATSILGRQVSKGHRQTGIVCTRAPCTAMQCNRKCQPVMP